MKWLKCTLALLLLFLSGPIWRLLDWAHIVVPSPIFFALNISWWTLFFIQWPIKLCWPKFQRKIILAITCMVFIIALLTGPLSNHSNRRPGLTHCGRLSYSGFFYPIRSLLLNSYQDDLEVKNQICWLRKSSLQVENRITGQSMPQKLDEMKELLMKPDRKFRASLPAVLYLFANYLAAWEQENADELSALEKGEIFIQGFNYWTEQYNEEISGRKYAWYEWPNSKWILIEYGLIEENWEKLFNYFKH
jgi:hypothetical protein